MVIALYILNPKIPWLVQPALKLFISASSTSILERRALFTRTSSTTRSPFSLSGAERVETGQVVQGVTELLEDSFSNIILKSLYSLILSLVFALFALEFCLFTGDANLFPKLTIGSFLAFPSRKCLQHNRDWALSWLSPSPNAASQLPLLTGSLGRR